MNIAFSILAQEGKGHLVAFAKNFCSELVGCGRDLGTARQRRDSPRAATARAPRPIPRMTAPSTRATGATARPAPQVREHRGWPSAAPAHLGARFPRGANARQ